MKLFLAEHLSVWAGMFCLAMYIFKNSIWWAIGFIAMFLVNTFFALYKHAQFVVFTADQREAFDRECEEKHAREQMAGK